MLRALSAAGADFLLVGAYAMAAHGVPRATGDLDIWVRPARDNDAGPAGARDVRRTAGRPDRGRPSDAGNRLSARAGAPTDRHPHRNRRRDVRDGLASASPWQSRRRQRSRDRPHGVAPEQAGARTAEGSRRHRPARSTASTKEETSPTTSLEALTSLR